MIINLIVRYYNDEINVSQFYIYASSDKFLSNQKQLKKLKKDNTETTVKQFINKLKNIIINVMNKENQILLIKKFLLNQMKKQLLLIKLMKI